MANKRQKKKNLKKRQERKLIQSGQSKKQVSKMSYSQREKVYNSIIQKESQKEKKKARSRALYNEKKAYINKYNLSSYADKNGKYINANSSWDDIKKAEKRYKSRLRKSKKYQRLLLNGASDEEAHRLVFGNKEISWKDVENYSPLQNRVFKINKAFAIGYRDYSENLTIEEIYSYSAYLSIETLRESLEDIVRLKPTFNRKKKIKSSGKAGDFRYYFGSIKSANIYPTRKKCRDFSFFMNNGEYAIYEFTLDNMMILAHAIMNNITEDRRSDFYNQFYTHLCSVVPEARKYFPIP